MRNWKKINLLGNLSSRQETPGDAVAKFIQGLVAQLESGQVQSDRVDLLTRILLQCEKYAGGTYPPVANSSFNDFFQFLSSLPAELNPENPFDEKYEQLASQTAETVQYLVSAVDAVSIPSDLSELYSWAGLSAPGDPSVQNTNLAGLEPEETQITDAVSAVRDLKPDFSQFNHPLALGFSLAELFEGVKSAPQNVFTAETPAQTFEEEFAAPVQSAFSETLLSEPVSDGAEITAEAAIEEEIVLEDDGISDLTDGLLEGPVSEELIQEEPGSVILSEEPAGVAEEIFDFGSDSAGAPEEQQPVSEESLESTEESDVLTEPQESVEAPVNHMQWLISQIISVWDSALTGHADYALIRQGMSELSSSPSPVSAFREVSPLPEYQEFIDFLELSDQNEAFDRDLVKPQIDQISNRVFELFTEILKQQTQDELGDSFSEETESIPVSSDEISENSSGSAEDLVLEDVEATIEDGVAETGTLDEAEEEVVSDSKDEEIILLEDDLSVDSITEDEPGESVLAEDLSSEDILADADVPEEQSQPEEPALIELETGISDESAFTALTEEPGHDAPSGEDISGISVFQEESAGADILLDQFVTGPDTLAEHEDLKPGSESVDYFGVIQQIYLDIKKLNSIQGNNTGINQFVDFSLSLKDPVEVLREHLNIQIAKEFIEYVDLLHGRYDNGEKNAYQEMLSHRMDIADQLFQVLLNNPEITGEEQPEETAEEIQTPDHLTPSTLHLVTDEDLAEETESVADELTEAVDEDLILTGEPGELTEIETLPSELSEEEISDIVVEEQETVSLDEPEIPDSEPGLPDPDQTEVVIEEPESYESESNGAEALISDEEPVLEDESLIFEEPSELADDTAGLSVLDETEPAENPDLLSLAEEDGTSLIEESLTGDAGDFSELDASVLEEPDLVGLETPEEPELAIIEDTLELPDDQDSLLELPDEPAEPAATIPSEKPKRPRQELNEIQQVFLLEADENIQKISTDLLELEKDLGNISIIDGILRSAHTLKGSAAMMKFSNMSKLGHKMEDVFQILRDEKIPADRDLIDIMLKGTDIQVNMLTSLREEGHDEVPGLEEATFNLVQYLNKLQAKLEGKEFTPEKFVQTEPVAKAEVPVSSGQEIQAAPAAQMQQDNRPKGVVAEQTLRINITTLNNLINLAAELLISRNRMNNQLGFMEGTLLKLQKEKLLLNSIMKKVSQFAGKTTDNASGFFSSEEQGILQDFAESEFDRFSDLDIILRDMRSNLSNFEDLSSEIRGFSDAFRQSILSVSSIANELNVEIMSMRMVPVKHMFIRFQRSIRDIGREESKDVDLKIEGEDTRLDKTVMEEVIEPIMHCVRNAVSHGIELPDTRRGKGKSETGLITLRAYQDGNQVVLEVEDDGNGIDAQRLKQAAISKRIVSAERAEAMTDTEAMELMFIPGFSTAEKVTSLSGRGVGMDVVKNVVTKFKGNISVKSTLGKGSCFTIRLPLTLAINQSLLIQAGGKTYAFPLSSVEETVELIMENIQKIGEQELITVRDQTIPLIHLNQVIGMEEDPASMKPKYPVVILSDADQKIAVRVDRLIGKEEIVVKTLGSHLKNVMGVMGATVLGDGSVILILDVSYLFRYWQGGKNAGTSVRSSYGALPVLETEGFMPDEEEAEETPKRPEPAKTRVRGKIRVLCADDSVSIRKYVESLLKREEYEVTTAQDGAEAYDIAEKNKFDLIMTDLEMPKMHGYELISALRSKPQFSQIPIVILTARSGEKHRRRGLELGANAFLNKPFDVDELLNTIHGLLGR